MAPKEFFYLSISKRSLTPRLIVEGQLRLNPLLVLLVWLWELRLLLVVASGMAWLGCSLSAHAVDVELDNLLPSCSPLTK
jgi:hypothetical protein